MKKRFLSLLLTVSMVASCVMTTGADTTTNTVDLTDSLIGEYLFDGDWEDEVTDNVATAYSAWGDYWLNEDPAKPDETPNPNTHPGPLLDTDATRGNVAELNGMWWNTGYVELNKEYVSDIDEGFSVSMWIKANNSKTENNLAEQHQSWFNIEMSEPKDSNADNWIEDYSFFSLDMSFEPWVNVTGNVAGITNYYIDRTSEAIKASTSTWNHVVMTLDPETDKVTVYIDGEKYIEKTPNCSDANVAASDIVDNMLDYISTNATSVKIGSFACWWAYYDTRGYVDDVRIYNKALSSDEVVALKAVEADTSVVPLIETIGAQANLDDATQLGFVTLISKAQFDATKNNIKEMGIVVKNSANATNLDLTVENATADGAIRKIVTNYVTDVTTLDSTKSDDLTYAFRSVIKGISDSSKTYTAVPYITYKDGTTVYGAEVTRSLAGL